jgi:formylglycine-generating enzyme
MKYDFAQGVTVAILCCTPIAAISSTYYDCIKADDSITYRAEPCLKGEKERRHFQVNLERFDSNKKDTGENASSNFDNLNLKRGDQNIAISTTRADHLSNVNEGSNNSSAMEVISQPAQPQTAGEQSVVNGDSHADKTFRDCHDCPEMVVVPMGSFEMGSPQSEVNRVRDDESPLHKVNVRSFAIGKYEVTVGQFALFVNEKNLKNKLWERQSPIQFHQEDNHPVVNVSWNEAKDYTNWLSQRTGKTYRLPSEAEWEYAARAGTTTSYYWGNNPDDACTYGNVLDLTAKAQIPWVSSNWKEFPKCSDGFAYTAPVGSFKPNAFGLYDMLGNAEEWVADCYHKSVGLNNLTLQSDTRNIFKAFVDYNGAPTDGSVWGSENCDSHMVRGGSWRYLPASARSAARSWGEQNYRGDPGHGFRVASSDSGTVPN